REVFTQALEERLAMRRNFSVLQFSQLTEELVLARRKLLGHLDKRLNMQIACRTPARIGHATAADPKYVARLRSRWNPQLVWTRGGGTFAQTPKGRWAVADRLPKNEMSPFPLEQLVLADRHKAVAIAGRPAIGTRLAIAGQPHPHAVIDAGGNRDIELRPL